jgi:F420-non-reducing hydrogenase iron-sulfur subunit
MEFKPKIIAFLCNWCSYTGADLAGTSRLKYAPNIRVIRVMCSGRVDPTFVMKSFREGADGVMILGCHPGDCHYHEGNYKCLRRFYLVEKYVQQMGIEKERLHLDWISASEGKQFAEVVDKFTADIMKLGVCKAKTNVETLS